jgi:hypothetical protein
MFGIGVYAFIAPVSNDGPEYFTEHGFIPVYLVSQTYQLTVPHALCDPHHVRDYPRAPVLRVKGQGAGAQKRR